ncbi:TcfC E-set like domain-containing protein [Vibrio chagasii]|uniref:TcfC E-set like domain-containing protein n=1 Tax=Vibrio chagasii TaxID=170679 RepID=UPI003DA0ECD5
MIKTNSTFYLAILMSGGAIISSPTAMANEDYYVSGAPKGFENFITFARGPISIQIPGASPLLLTADYRFGEVKVTLDDSQEKLRVYLEKNAVKSQIINEIINNLNNGVLNSALCVGDTKKCTIAQASIDFVFDFDSRKMRLFLSPTYFSQRTQSVSYIDGNNNNLGLINNFNAFTSAWNEQGLSLTINDDTFVSLPYGHLRSDLSYHADANDSDIDANELSYNLDIRRHSLGLGRFKYEKDINSTAFLNYEVTPDKYAVYFGTSERLMINGTRQHQSLGFYASEQGTLKILRDDKVILQRNTLEGQGNISYGDLPSGIYDVDIVLETAGQELSRERKTIVNVSQFSLPKGEWDYSIQGGQYIHSAFSLDADDSLDNQAYLKSAVSFRPVEPIMVGSELITSGSDYNVKFGVLGYLSNDINTQLVSSIFQNRSNYLRFLVNAGTATLDYSDYNYYPDSHNRNPNLASYLLGEVSYRNLSISQSFTLGSGAGYASLYYRDEHDYTPLGEESEYTGVTLGYTIPFMWKSTLNWSANYAFSKSSSDNWQAGINWAIPIGDSSNARTSVLVNQDHNQVRVGAERRWDINEQTKATLSTGVQHEDNELTYDASGTIDAQRSWGETSLYAYTDNRGSRGVTSSLSSTQVVKNKEVLYTTRPARSYILAEANQNIDSHYGTLKLTKNKIANYNFGMNKTKTLIPVDDYSSLTGNLDIDESKYNYLGEKEFSYFSYPGSVYHLENSLYKTSYLLAYIPNTHENDLKCTNDACISIEEQRDDIFKITVKSERKFKLLKGNKMCKEYDSGLKENKNIGELSCS